MEKKLYRVFTENKNLADILEAVTSRFDGFTYYETQGVWKGEREQSLCIEIMGSDWDGVKVERLAREIKRLNDQESVLVEVLSINAKFI